MYTRARVRYEAERAAVGAAGRGSADGFSGPGETHSNEPPQIGSAYLNPSDLSKAVYCLPTGESETESPAKRIHHAQALKHLSDSAHERHRSWRQLVAAVSGVALLATAASWSAWSPGGIPAEPDVTRQVPGPPALGAALTPSDALAIGEAPATPRREQGGSAALADGPRDATRSEGELVITSAPAGARVSINGVGWGETPVTVRYQSFGNKAIRITRDGYRAQERSVRLGAEQASVKVHVILQEFSGRRRIEQ